MGNKKTLKIGTRTSALARVQTDMVVHSLKLAYPNIDIEVVPIKASGDWKPEMGEKRLSEAAGGKGLFIKEVEQAILDGSINCGVHNVKDVPSFLPEQVDIDHILERQDARDVLVGTDVKSLHDLPPGTVVGTSSVRRQAILLHERPDLVIKPLRGNIDTRLEKLRAGQVDVAILAAVGLHRINRAHEIAVYLEPDDMMPACGQGTLCIETRLDDVETRALMDCLHHTKSGLITFAERAVLQDLDGSCRTPISAYATLSGHMMTCEAWLAAPDGVHLFKAKAMAQVLNKAQALELGTMVAKELRDKAGDDMLVCLSVDYHKDARHVAGQK